MNIHMNLNLLGEARGFKFMFKCMFRWIYEARPMASWWPLKRMPPSFFMTRLA